MERRPESLVNEAAKILSEAGKLYAYSKDGVKKQIRTPAEGDIWRQTMAKPPKVSTKKDPNEQERILPDIAWIVQAEVANFFPDSDGLDSIFKKVRKSYPQISIDKTMDLVNKACKKLGAKNFQDYLDTFHEDFRGQL